MVAYIKLANYGFVTLWIPAVNCYILFGDVKKAKMESFNPKTYITRQVIVTPKTVFK